MYSARRQVGMHVTELEVCAAKGGWNSRVSFNLSHWRASDEVAPVEPLG